LCMERAQEKASGAWMFRFTALTFSNLTWRREQSKALRSKKPAHKTISNMCLFETPRHTVKKNAVPSLDSVCVRDLGIYEDTRSWAHGISVWQWASH